jgi:hypothetical protein
MKNGVFGIWYTYGSADEAQDCIGRGLNNFEYQYSSVL